jgi:hypothetical protein
VNQDNQMFFSKGKTKQEKLKSKNQRKKFLEYYLKLYHYNINSHLISIHLSIIKRRGRLILPIKEVHTNHHEIMTNIFLKMLYLILSYHLIKKNILLFFNIFGSKQLNNCLVSKITLFLIKNDFNPFI